MTEMCVKHGGIDRYQIYVNGAWIESECNDYLQIENPATEAIIAETPAGNQADVEKALEAARAAFPAWAGRPAIERATLLWKLADLVERDVERLAHVITAEEGKPLREGREELGGTATFLRWAAESARRIEGDIMPSDNPNERIQIHRVPFGVVVALTAWNFPSALVTRKMGPALATGNTMVVKPHEATPLSALALAQLADEAGFPPGVFNVVTGEGRSVGETLVSHPITKLVTMTGSVRAGREIMKAGSENITKLCLELGGKAPFMIMEDADIDRAVDAAAGSRFYNCGQVCTCNERMYVHEQVADEFTEKLIQKIGTLRVGNPLKDVDLGPKTSRLELEKVEAMVDAAVAQGAEILTGGNRLSGGEYEKGHWYAPTVLVNVDNTNDIMLKEIFGPVIPIMRIGDFEEALALSNDSPYGLSAYLFTHDLRRVERLAGELNFGEIFVNRPMGEAINAFHSGYGLSGVGGEDGKYGVDGYLQKKTIYINRS